MSARSRSTLGAVVGLCVLTLSACGSGSRALDAGTAAALHERVDAVRAAVGDDDAERARTAVAAFGTDVRRLTDAGALDPQDAMVLLSHAAGIEKAIPQEADANADADARAEPAPGTNSADRTVGKNHDDRDENRGKGSEQKAKNKEPKGQGAKEKKANGRGVDGGRDEGRNTADDSEDRTGDEDRFDVGFGRGDRDSDAAPPETSPPAEPDDTDTDDTTDDGIGDGTAGSDPPGDDTDDQDSTDTDTIANDGIDRADGVDAGEENADD